MEAKAEAIVVEAEAVEAKAEAIDVEAEAVDEIAASTSLLWTETNFHYRGPKLLWSFWEVSDDWWCHTN